MSITARRAIFSDIPLLVALMSEFYAEANYPLDHQWATSSFTVLLSNESYGATWLVSSNAETAGYIALTTHFSMEYGGLCGTIDDLFVRPAFRRQGAGRVALETLLAHCQRQGLLSVQVETAPDNTAAQSLYRSCNLHPRPDQRETLTLTLPS